VQVVQGADHVTVVRLEHVDVGRQATGVGKGADVDTGM
jgi:hypothetical protein